MIEFRLLGPLHLTDAHGREVQSLLTRPRRLALLAYLAAATPRRLHRRDSLLPLFWPELDQEHARAALRQALHVVREALGGGPDVIVTRGDEEVGLDLDQVSCDVVAFDRAVAAGQSREALELYHGNLLEGFFIPEAGDFEQWLETERARLVKAAAQSARVLLEQSQAEGDVTAAVEWARRAAQLAPHDEELQRRLITLLDRHGDRAGAVESYEEFAKRLGADLETEPAAETKAVISAVRARQIATPVEPAGAPSGQVPPVAAPPRRGRQGWWRVGIAAVVAGLDR